MTKLKIMTINLRGIGTQNKKQSGENRHKKFRNFCQHVKSWAAKKICAAVAGQEHNMDPDEKDTYIRIAADCKLDLVIGFSDTPCHRGGCFLLTDQHQLKLNAKTHEEPSLARASYEYNGDEIDLASIYAPAGALQRINFFSHLKSKLSVRTIAGGDWNCVPDVTQDVKGKKQLSYPNIGGGPTRKTDGRTRPK